MDCQKLSLSVLCVWQPEQSLGEEHSFCGEKCIVDGWQDKVKQQCGEKERETKENTVQKMFQTCESRAEFHNACGICGKKGHNQRAHKQKREAEEENDMEEMGK